MSESYYFCIFCDTFVKTSNELFEHLVQHFTHSDDNQCQKTITKSENNFIENSLIRYETEINECFQMTPKTLPEDNVSQLLIGCPVCDAIIKCFELMVNKDKSQCGCGEDNQLMDVFKCIECQQSFHFECRSPEYQTGLQLI